MTTETPRKSAHDRQQATLEAVAEMLKLHKRLEQIELRLAKLEKSR